MVYEENNPSKQRKRERAALPHLPITPHTPPKDKTNHKQGIAVCRKKAKLGVAKCIFPLKEREKNREVGG